LRAAGKVSKEIEPDLESDTEYKEQFRDMVKLWKIFDLRERKLRIMIEGMDKFLLEDDLETRRDGTPIVPIGILRFHNRLREFYPLPPVFNWIPVQNELNETREMQRIHRKRFKRKFQMRAGGIVDGELEKWENGGDGTLIVTSIDDAIKPIADAPLDPTVVRNIPQTKQDFQEVAGITGEQEGVAESETATQANILDVRSRIRESKGRAQVAEFLAALAKLAMEIIERRMSLPFWIRTNVDLSSPAASQEAAEVEQAWKLITVQELGQMDYDVTVKVDSMTPMVEAGEREGWVQALSLLANPATGPMILANDVLLRKTLGYFGASEPSLYSALRSP